MKLKYILTVLAAAFIFSACDEIKAPYQPDASELYQSLTDDNKKVLILEFTGYECGNCPQAHHIIHDLEAKYPEGHIVPIAVHSGFYADPTKNPAAPDLTSEEGENLDEYFNASMTGFPTGSINLKKINGDFLIPRSTWEKEAFNEAKQQKEVDITLDASYDEESKDIKVTATVDYLNDIYNGSNLSVYLVQDSIIGLQKDDHLPGTQKYIKDYVHMNVFRTSFSGIWGTPVLMSNNTKELTINIADHPDWDVNNLKVVAFVHDYKGTQLVLQAENTKVKK